MSMHVEKYKIVQLQGLSVFNPTGRPPLPAMRSAGELWRLACSGGAAIVGAAHNRSFERTRPGNLLSAFISFWASSRLPGLAAQLQR
jgi:hypothetical protein